MNTSRFHVRPIGQVFISLLLALFLGACATTTVDLDKRLDKTEEALIVAKGLADVLYTNGLISETDWPQVQAGFTKAFTDVEHAKQWSLTNEGEAISALDGAQALLTELNKRLYVMQEQGATLQAPRMKPPTAAPPR